MKSIAWTSVNRDVLAREDNSKFQRDMHAIQEGLTCMLSKDRLSSTVNLVLSFLEIPKYPTRIGFLGGVAGSSPPPPPPPPPHGPALYHLL